jgi:septal ring factor EnvC (AmiA/AmiB activator)
MTSVGRFLIVLIMAFSLLFLAITTTVFVTAKNWMQATRKEHDDVEKLKKKVTEALAKADASKKDLEDAKTAFDAQAKQSADALESSQAENKHNVEELTKVRTQSVKHEQTARSSLDEVEAKRQETALLRTQKSEVEKQANEFKLHEAELKDQIRDLERKMDTATRNNSELRDNVARLSTVLRANGLSDDVRQIKGTESPPPVIGIVKRVHSTNRRVEISIGSDDGLVVGHELFIYRTEPRPEYLGKITIIEVDPDQAVGKVIGNTYQGKKLKEGDIVSSTIRPR